MTCVQIAEVAIVSAEQLIAAIATDDHLDVAAGETCQEPGAKRQRVRRLIERADQVGQGGRDVRRDGFVAMMRAEQLSHLACGGGFIEAPIVQADREGLKVFGAELARHHRDQQARIQAAAQEGAHGHVADHVEFQRFFQLGLQCIDQIVERGCQLRQWRRAPVSLYPRCLAVLENE